MKLLFFCLVYALVISGSQVLSQTPKKPLIKQCDALMAQQLVEQQAIESKSTTESDKRINILIRVADYLWDKDNASARKYFAEAFNIAKERFKEIGIRNRSTTKFYSDPEPDYRFVVTRTVSKRDAEWARKLSEEILKSFDEDETVAKRERYQQHAEITESLNLAILLLDSNEAAAAAIFRRLIDYQLTPSWNRALYRIAAKNPSLAIEIYTALLARHLNANIQDLISLSAFPFGRTQTFSVGVHVSGPTIQTDYTPSIELQRRFLAVFFARIRSLSAESVSSTGNQRISDAGYAVGALAQMAPIINQNFPELSAELARLSAHAGALIDDETRTSLEFGNKFKEQFSKTFFERLEALSEADDLGNLKDFDIVRLISDAKTQEELNAFEKWLDRIKDPIVKEKSVNLFYFTSSKLAIKDSRFTDARKSADKVPQIEFKAILYFDIAEAKLKKPLEKYETFEILTEVFRIAEKAPDSVEKAQVLLGVGFMFEKIDYANSIEAISKSIRTANKLDNPNLFTSNISQQITGEDFGVFSNYSVPGFDINKTFDQISKRDFTGAISLAEDFTDKYLRTLAVLASVKDCKTIDTKQVKPIQEKSGKPAL